MDSQTTTERTPAPNSGFAKKRVQWLIEHSTSHQLLWYVDSFVLRNPLLRKAANRWLSLHKYIKFMGLFNLFSKKSLNPYKDEGLNKNYDLLFCDNPELYKQDNSTSVYPWNIIFCDTTSVDKLQVIVRDEKLESRPKILAHNLLLRNGYPEKERQLLGVIVEVSMPQGLDVLAAYSDGTARYINHSEKLLVWESKTEQSKALISNLFAVSLNVVNQIGVWNKKRKPSPNNGMVRLTFLVSDGLYFGEGQSEVLQNDPMGAPVITSATELLAYLTQQPK